MKKILFALALTGLCARAARAQQELVLYQQDNLWHANALNPAFYPENKRIFVGLPAFGVDVAHSGDISYRDFIQDGNLNFSKLIDRLEPQNQFYYGQRFETLSLGLRLPAGLALQAGHAFRLNSTVEYPKNLVELLWNGNGPYVGQTLNIAPNVQSFDWSELFAGAAYCGERFSAGARIKLLSGISALDSDEGRNLATVFTDDDIYQLRLTMDYGFHAASTITSIDTSGLWFDLETEIRENTFFSENRGTAFDLGFSYRVGERWQVSASALDLGGKIEWTSSPSYFLSQGEYEYEGVVFPGTDIINSADSIDFDSKLDTLNDIFNFAKTPQSFSTRLPVRYYAAVQYDFSERWQFGATFFHQDGALRQTSALGLSARWSPLSWLQLGGMYSFNSRSAANLGFNLGLTPGPVQLYLVSDNLLNVFRAASAPALNFRLGASVVF